MADPVGCQPDQEALRGAGKDIGDRAMAVIGDDVSDVLGKLEEDSLQDQVKQQNDNLQQVVVRDMWVQECDSAATSEPLNERVPTEVLAATPPYWSSRDANGRYVDWVRVTQAEQDLLQQLLDDTFQAARTRDRKGGDDCMPTGLKLIRASRVENALLWRRYAGQRWNLGSKMRPGGYTALSRMHPSEVMTSYNKICKKGDLDGQLNEVYLWHGTSLRDATTITSEGFSLALAESNAGSMYGNGVTLAECCSKADEYAEDEKQGPGGGVHCLLLCRAVLGEILQVKTGGLATHSMIQESLDTGEFHSVLGSRAAVASTYREFVVYKEAQVYPEYMVHYRRDFEPLD